jgi:hypothetical protein
MKLIGEMVVHKKFGKGKIIAFSQKLVEVSFDEKTGNNKFTYPDSFGAFIEIENGLFAKQINDEKEEIPEISHKKQDEIKEHYLTHLKNKYIVKQENSTFFSMNIILFSISLLIMFMLPIVWFMQAETYEISYKIDGNKLFSESFQNYYSEKLIALPEVEKLEFKNGETIVKLKLEKEKEFLKKIESIFSSTFLPQCEIDLTGEKIIKIYFSELEKKRQINIALATLSQKIHVRLRSENISNYSLVSNEEGILTLKISKNIDYKKINNLFMNNHISIHQLINGNSKENFNKETELIVKNSIDKKYNELVMIDSTKIKRINANQNEIVFFWNLLGNMNLQKSFETKNYFIKNPIFLLEGIPQINLEKSFKQVISNSKKLLLTKDIVANEKIFLNGEIRLTKKKEFVFELSQLYINKDKKEKKFSFLPLVVVIDNEARAIIYNPDKISPQKGLIYGFNNKEDIFKFLNMIQSALPSYVLVK